MIAPRFPIRNTKVVSRVPEILRLCAGRKVLHLGCADVPYTLQRGTDLLHRRLSGVTGPELLWGIDASEEGVRLLRSMGFDHIMVGDGEALPVELKREAFDVLLAGEIIEHLANPGRFLQSLTSIMTEETELLLTTCNASSFKQFVHAMLREEKVHADHNYYFSYRTLKQLLEKFHLRCVEIYYYQEVEGRGLARVLDLAVSAVTRIWPLWSDGVVVRATL